MHLVDYLTIKYNHIRKFEEIYKSLFQVQGSYSSQLESHYFDDLAIYLRKLGVMEYFIALSYSSRIIMTVI